MAEATATKLYRSWLQNKKFSRGENLTQIKAQIMHATGLDAAQVDLRLERIQAQLVGKMAGGAMLDIHIDRVLAEVDAEEAS